MTPVEKLFDSAEWSAETHAAPADLETGMLYAVREGKLRIGAAVLDCVVLNDGTRVFTADSLARFFGGEV